MSGILAAIGVLLLVVMVTLAAASFFRHMLAAAVTLTAVPVSVLLFALVGVYDTVFVFATLAIVACVIRTITDTFRLARNARPQHRLQAHGNPRIWSPWAKQIEQPSQSRTTGRT